MESYVDKLNQWIGSQEFWVTIILFVLMVSSIWTYQKKRRFKQRFVQEAQSDAVIGGGMCNQEGVDSYDTLRRLGSTTITVVFLMVILAVNGVNVSAPLAGLGILGTIVGLACQDVMKDTVMGVRIVKDGFFLVGDMVEINGIRGVVVDFNLRHTKIEAFSTHTVLCICNGQITSVEKLSLLIRVDLPFRESIPYQKAKQGIQHMCAKIWELQGVENCYFHGISSIQPDGVHYTLCIYTKKENYSQVRRKANAIIKEVMEQEGLETPITVVKIEE